MRVSLSLATRCIEIAALNPVFKINTLQLMIFRNVKALK
ncbi:MAG: hypothetical protein AVDCRST_MAG95-2481 [uncultured Adhaeribacter sp.]|uniref:Uncharacterized protein n=1 Tax=uncultured Adhaeribacter sp. TaxID=448109 RepID=A0A6J4IXW1_9BACT|nr:MAG: hypothetical protein AVDCRST_MAG95-2481 [uncultured Adhaeribacter sp.]